MRAIHRLGGAAVLGTAIVTMLASPALASPTHSGTHERGPAERAIADLPGRQREVVTLRDLDGLSSEEVCGVPEITEANQRVLLHRGRSRLRQLLESELGRA
jgi:DNA-directed RNA polymerase specialized sigma24 family protein